MSFNTALSSPQQTQLRLLRWQGNQLVSLCDNVIAFQALVTSNLNSLPGSTTAKIAYNTVSVGAYTNLDEGMVVIVSPNSDIRNVNAVRLHVTYHVSDATYIYVSEFSEPISVGATIFVLYAYDIIDNLSRPVGTNPVIQYQQYDQNFQRMAPVINGAKSGYANRVDSGGHLTIAFDLSTTFAAEYGKSISAYLATVKATGAGTSSVTAGALNTSAFTLQLTYGEYWLKLTAQDSGGVSYFRHVLIKAHDPVNYPPSVGFEGIEITRDISGGPSARIKAFTGVSSVLNGTEVIIWVDDEQYSDPLFTNAAGPLLGANDNIDLVGWIEAEENMFMTDPTYSAYAECQFEVQGVGSRLMRLEGQLLAITNNASPSKWDEINKLTIWRAIVHFLQRHTTALQLCDFTFQNMSADETFLFPTLTTIAGRALDNVTGSQGLAELINAQVEFASDGRMELTRREQFVASDLGHTPVVVATFDGRDMAGSDALRWKFNQYRQYGYLSADGAVWDGTAPSVTPYLARAPGLAQGSGPDQGRLNNQVLASTTSPTVAQGELSQRAGTQWSIDNETGELTIAHLSQHHWLQPSYGQCYVWSLDSTYNIRGLTLDSTTHWLLKSLTIRHENKTGARDVRAVYIPVITGTPAAPVPVINANSIPPALPLLPPMPAFDFEFPETVIPDIGLSPSQLTPTSVIVDHKGGCVLEINSNGAALSITKTYISLTSPVWYDITPTNLGAYTLVDACFDQLNATGGKTPVYALAFDGTNSAVFYCPDALGGGLWTIGQVLDGEYSVIRTTQTPGTILVYRPTTSGNWSKEWFGGNGNSPAWTVDFGTYNAGTDQIEGASTLPAPYDTNNASAKISFSSSTIKRMVLVFDYQSFDTLGGNTWTLYGTDGYSSPIDSVDPPTNSSGTYVFDSGTVSFVATGMSFILGTPEHNGPGYTHVKYAYVEGSGTSPFAGSGNGAHVAYSTTYGATWAAIHNVGNSPGSVGGFDVQQANGVSVTASDLSIDKASTLGGLYSSILSITDQATDLVIPWYRIGSDSVLQTTASDPDILVGFDGVTTIGSCIAYIDGATGSLVSMTQPVANATVPGPDCLTILRGTKIAGIFDVSGTRKLYVSEDRGVTWTFVENVGATATLRCRRNDDRTGSHRGQIFVFDTPSGYSSAWAFSGEKDRTSPPGTILAGDVLG